ncbi:NTE family protein [Thiohalospira halophila DSM 15071]|uniref:NTE family protein n=1 Tax=Thiohalospira halophila DSM 15071 TaxID=1123397 RepID=A0A1I1P8M0_9GAMM|nr:patatin-like phospholipase RssA [Thiohalospira halophila]SFD04008.1 NTE family protein [Thiohalospira halophila DSM 15071]
MTATPRIGLALGTGAARGWAHIGVLRALEERGIRPDIVCGTSIGALVGASWAADDMDRLEEWLRGLSWRDVLGYMDFTLGNGLIQGRRLFEFFRERFEDQPVDQLAVPWGAVATDLHTGMEVWLREGERSTLDAVRASVSLPGLFTPVKHGDRWLVDGGLVNPVPISLCRALGAETVIAVDISSFRLTGPPARRKVAAGKGPRRAEADGWLDNARAWTDRLLEGVGWGSDGQEEEVPSLFEVLSHSINIMQARIARSRMAGDPPDALVKPRMEHVALMDFHRAAEAIEEGRAAVRRADPALEDAGLR